MPTTGNRGLRFKYSSGIAPLVTSTEYTDLINNYKKMGASAFPHILKLGGMAVDTTQNRNKWRIPLKDLYECAAQLNGAPLMKDHDIDHVNSIIGKVRSAWVEEDGAGGGKVMWEGETIDQDLIPKILLGYVKNNSIQIAIPEAYCDNCVTHLGKQEADAALDNLDFPCPRCGSLEMIARRPMVLEQSMVAIPAYEKAEVSPIGFKAALDDFNEKRIENAKKAGWKVDSPAPTLQVKTPQPSIAPLMIKVYTAVAQIEIGTLETQIRFLAANLEEEADKKRQNRPTAGERHLKKRMPMGAPESEIKNEAGHPHAFQDWTGADEICHSCNKPRDDPNHMGGAGVADIFEGVGDVMLQEDDDAKIQALLQKKVNELTPEDLQYLDKYLGQTHYSEESARGEGRDDDECHCDQYYPEQCPSCLLKSQSQGMASTHDEAGGSVQDFPLAERPNLTEEGSENGDTCPQCGGELMELGSLGRRKHYRCRNCGADSSSDASQDNESELSGGTGSRLP